MDELSELRLAENEVIFREANKSAQKFAEESGSLDATFSFYCECSDLDCRERIKLTGRKYKELHQNPRQFVTIKGHARSEIEKVLSIEDNYQVVEKYADPPPPEDLNAALNKLKL